MYLAILDIRGYIDNSVDDGDNVLAVANDYHGCTSACTLHDSL